MSKLSEEFKKHLLDLANKETIYDKELSPDEASGGNYDDAYSIGSEDGEIYLAREVLKELSDE